MKHFKSAKEMMQALLDGKKIAKDCYKKGLYAYLNENGEIVDKEGDNIYPDINEPTKYFIYEEPKKVRTIEYVEYAFLHNNGTLGGLYWFPSDPVISEGYKRTNTPPKIVEVEE